VADASNRSPEGPQDKVWRWSHESYLNKKELLVYKETRNSPLQDQNGKQSKYNIYTKYYLEDRIEDGIRPRDFLDGLPNELGTRALKELGLEGLFDFPKPIELIQKFLTWIHDKDALVIDFFAGSGTTGHAVAKQNEMDGGTRRYLLVTLPEQTGENSNARNMGIDKVSDITKLRLQKVMEQIPSAKARGLRNFKLSGSAFADTAPVDGQLFSETLYNDTPDDAIASEIFLKSGVRLDMPWQRLTVATSPVIISDGVAVVLSRTLDDDIVAGLLKNEECHTVVFLEDAFAGLDDVKANAYFAFKQASKTMKTI